IGNLAQTDCADMVGQSAINVNSGIHGVSTFRLGLISGRVTARPRYLARGFVLVVAMAENVIPVVVAREIASNATTRDAT
ncbi:hypothetical protein, partial [Klebsiella pneumoniae]|uniref:hypothetical protein n=1 Tax=Klebsiella pneumoniae TaxID=573 RepID=UPI001954D078